MSDSPKIEILVLDDEETIRNLLKIAFNQEGISVVEAESAEAALELTKKHPVKAMVVDMNLPGMNGMEFGRAVRRDFRDTKMYAITGMPSKSEFSDCRKAGFDGYFTKPLNIKLFIKTVVEDLKENG